MIVSSTPKTTIRLANPDAKLLLMQANNILAQEQRKREAFYNDINEQQKAEFINGEVVIHSPVKIEHNEGVSLLSRLLSIYVDRHQLGFVGIEKVMIALTRNDYEPDICFFKREKAQHFQPRQTLFPAPDLVIEFLSKGTAHIDRGIKYIDYQASGIQEYWIIDPIKQVLEQYRLQDGAYQLIIKSNSGSIECQPLDNFNFPIQAIFDGNENLKLIQTILST